MPAVPGGSRRSDQARPTNRADGTLVASGRSLNHNPSQPRRAPEQAAGLFVQEPRGQGMCLSFARWNMPTFLGHQAEIVRIPDPGRERLH
jgi:hypothetical protein